MFRLDYISCVLTISAAILLGRKRWQGWLVAGINSILICDIAVNTSQLGFIPANVFCVALYAYNIVGWRKQIKTHPGPDTHLRASSEHMDRQSGFASQQAARQTIRVSRPVVEDLRLETFCCERSIPSSLDNAGRSGRRPDLRSLMCPWNP